MFVEAQRTTGEALANIFVQTLDELGIDKDKMRAQGYVAISHIN